jgi:hypothetical protein
MSASHNSALNVVGTIFYGLVAGFAATAVIVLGFVFLGSFACWIFHYLGWMHGGELSLACGLGSVYYTVIPGLVIGVIVCAKVWNRRLRSAPTA